MANKASTAALGIIMAVLLTVGGITATVGQAFATHFDDISSSSPVWQERPAYYLTTYAWDDEDHNVNESINVKNARKWSTIGSAEYYKLNAAELRTESGYTWTEVKNDINGAKSEWTGLTTISNGPILTEDGNTTTTASLLKDECGLGSPVDDTYNVIQFCNLGGTGGAVVQNYQWISFTEGLDIEIQESDMMIDSKDTSGQYILWGDSSTDSHYLRFIALHEFGHFAMALGDLYQLYLLGSCDDSQTGSWDNEPVMCGRDSEHYSGLHEGDKSGAAFLYPKRHSQSLSSFGGTIVGADSAVGTLDHSDDTTNSLNDLMIVYADYNPSDSKYYIRIKPMWDLTSSGVATTVGLTTNMLSTSNTVYDVGATIANVNNQGSSDLVISYTAQVSGVAKQHFITFFDVEKNVSNNGLSVGSWTSIYSHSGATPARGSDVVIFNFDSDNGNEIGLLHTKESTDTRAHLYIGDINTSGVVSSVFAAGNSGSSSLIVPRAGGDVGFSIVGINTGGVNDQRVFSINFDGNNDYVQQHIVHVNATFWISHGWTNKYGPLYDNNANFAGIGSGDSIFLDDDGDDKTENFHVYVIGTTAYYTIEWNNRWNSHI